MHVGKTNFETIEKVTEGSGARKFIRHPSDIPIEYKIEKEGNDKQQNLSNISQGGVAFDSVEKIKVGRMLQIKIAATQPTFKAYGKVVWCKKNATGTYEIGLELLDPQDIYRTRMIEQCCHIEHYKNEVLKEEGRHLTGAEAAEEWIKKYGDKFPQFDES